MYSSAMGASSRRNLSADGSVMRKRSAISNQPSSQHLLEAQAVEQQTLDGLAGLDPHVGDAPPGAEALNFRQPVPDPLAVPVQGRPIHADLDPIPRLHVLELHVPLH